MWFEGEKEKAMQRFSKAMILNRNKKVFARDSSQVFQSFHKTVIPFCLMSGVSDSSESLSLCLGA